jgi:uncharacterized membrane protein
MLNTVSFKWVDDFFSYCSASIYMLPTILIGYFYLYKIEIRSNKQNNQKFTVNKWNETFITKRFIYFLMLQRNKTHSIVFQSGLTANAF